MTLTQLEYLIAVDAHRHFATAAQACFVTQPTLSMQLQKLEEEIGVKIFDRSKQPVIPTEAGVEIIAQARKIITEKNNLLDMLASRKGIINGELKVGIIPTLAPYLLPLFIQSFTKKYPGVKLLITELTTDVIISRLKESKIDVGILVTPLHENGIQEQVLFYEEMVAYLSESNVTSKKTYLLPKDIDPTKLWLLEEGHCFRSQIMNLCELRKTTPEGGHFEYEAGSFETLRRMVDLYDGITILPELATTYMTASQKKHLRVFKKPVPVREVSIVVHRNFVKKRLVDALKSTILAAVPSHMKTLHQQTVVNV